jgi:hypothetical protein
MTEQEIQILIEMDADVWDAYLPYLSAHIKQQITLGSFTGLSEAQILENITSAVLSEAQVQTLITTTLNNYSRSINLLMMEEASANTLFRYVGPIDNKTRDICLKQGAEGHLTFKEIVNTYGRSVLQYGGGYNCRHSWEEVSDIDIMKELYDPAKAKGLLSGN